MNEESKSAGFWRHGGSHSLREEDVLAEEFAACPCLANCNACIVELLMLAGEATLRFGAFLYLVPYFQIGFHMLGSCFRDLTI